jgi:hypothetical protein
MKSFYTTTALRIALIVGCVAILVFLAVLRNDGIGSTFATGSGTGGLEMKIDSKTFYNGVLQPKLSWTLKHLQPWCDFFFKFLDVKPGDTGVNLISIHIKKNPAWVCLDFLNLKDRENGRNEPEGHEDNNNQGELSKELEFFAWRDDGDNIFEVGEKPLFGTSTQNAAEVLKGKSYALADSKHLPAYVPNQTKYIGITWCAGDLTVNTTTAVISCDATAMGNEAQTDSMKLDVALRAVSANQQKTFTCTGEKPKKGNNGHGNDNDHNDDSNPGNSNDENDDTDDDGLPGNGNNDDNPHNDGYVAQWHKKDTKTKAQDFIASLLGKFGGKKT